MTRSSTMPGVSAVCDTRMSPMREIIEAEVTIVAIRVSAAHAPKRLCIHYASRTRGTVQPTPKYGDAPRFRQVVPFCC